MKEEKILDILHSKMENLRKQFSKLPASFQQDDVHDYRVEMKKLQALIHLLNTDLPFYGKIKIGKKAKDFYALTGNLRNLQLHQQQIISLAAESHLVKPVSYLRFLEKKIAQTLAQLNAIVKHNSIQKCNHLIIPSFPIHLTAFSCGHYLLQQEKEIVRFLKSPLHTDEDFHAVRKTAKDFALNRKYVAMLFPFSLPCFFADNERLNQLTEKLGAFHDSCVALSLLNAFAAGVKMQGEKAVLQHLQLVIQQSKEILRRSLSKMLFNKTIGFA